MPDFKCEEVGAQRHKCNELCQDITFTYNCMPLECHIFQRLVTSESLQLRRQRILCAVASSSLLGGTKQLSWRCQLLLSAHTARISGRAASLGELRVRGKPGGKQRKRDSGA